MPNRNLYRLMHRCALLLMTCALLAGACTQAPALPRQQAEQELVAFVLHYMLPSQPGQATTYVERSSAHWADAPANASIVVWAPPLDSLKNASIEYLKSDEPIKVWWYADQQLVEVIDKENAIQQFQQAKFGGPFPNDTGGSYYEFGILSLSDGNQGAKVYTGTWCGPLCGSGMLYTLRRSPAGKWEVTESEMRWIS